MSGRGEGGHLRCEHAQGEVETEGNGHGLSLGSDNNHTFGNNRSINNSVREEG